MKALIGSDVNRRWGAVVICGLVAAVVYAAPDSDTSLRSWFTFHDFGHVIAFGFVTAVLSLAMPARTLEGRDRMRSAGLWAVVALGIGAAVEVVQALTGGYGDPWDVVRDAGGVCSVALIWLAADRTTTPLVRTLLAAGAAATLTAFILPTLMALADESRARAQFPVLVSFETTRELSRFEFADGVQTTLVSLPNSVQGMRVRLPPGKYPGFTLRYFPRDWRSMQALQLQLVNPDPTPWAMTVRLDDQHYDYRVGVTDRYNRMFVLQPGLNRIDIPLSEIAAAPRLRRLDLGRMRTLVVYAVDLAAPRDILVGPIALK